MGQKFTVDIRKLTYGELWRISPGMPFVNAFFIKLFGIRLKMSSTVPMVDHVVVLDPQTVDADIRQALAPPLEEWKQLGFGLQFLYTIPFGPGQRACAAALLSLDGLTLGQVMFAESSAHGLTKRRVVSSCVSRLADGTVCGTNSERRRFNPPPGYFVVNMPGKPLSALFERHIQELKKRVQTYAVPLRKEDLEPFIVWLNNRHVEFNVQRGVYVPAEGPAPSPIG